MEKKKIEEIKDEAKTGAIQFQKNVCRSGINYRIMFYMQRRDEKRKMIRKEKKQILREVSDEVKGERERERKREKRERERVCVCVCVSE